MACNSRSVTIAYNGLLAWDIHIDMPVAGIVLCSPGKIEVDVGDSRPLFPSTKLSPYPESSNIETRREAASGVEPVPTVMKFGRAEPWPRRPELETLESRGRDDDSRAKSEGLPC